MNQTRPLCLASASPRREALLRQVGLRVQIRPVRIDEGPRAGESPEALVARLALAKARAALASCGEEGVIGGDTLVVVDGEPLGKPADAAQGAAMLRRLGGRTHRVLSAYALLAGADGPSARRTVETHVTFRALPEAWIAWYSALPESRDKAGAYAIQGVGAAMVSRIDGSYSNVVGLPVEQVFWDMVDLGWVAL